MNEEIEALILSLTRMLPHPREEVGERVVFTAVGVQHNMQYNCLLYRTGLNGEPEGLVSPIPLEPIAPAIVLAIREAAFNPEVGPWYRMTVDIFPEDITVEFDADNEPKHLGVSLSLDEILHDRGHFNVDEEVMPEWLYRRVQRGE